mmetsp:Transcript_9725/g.13748  ORF Transcript_9725/g.13748 Transcript_9725/m.13748 type:complete len:184 (-) Transcript_9725:137-688(-)
MFGRRRNVNTNSEPSGNRSSIVNSSISEGPRRSTSISKQKNSNSFHPKLITAQIISLQSIHYLVLSILFQMNYFLFGKNITIDRIFTVDHLNIWEGRSWPDVGAILLSSIIGSFLLMFIVEKAKKVLDFAVTLTFIHLMACTIYGGIPSNFDWWIVHILGMIITILLGEYLCSRRELREIPML